MHTRIVVGSITILLLVAGVWYWQSRRSVETVPSSAAPSVEESIGTQVFEKTQNPIKDELPQTNPFEVETNPFSGAETNPLKNVIKNPF